jgi:hypothetical protein
VEKKVGREVHDTSGGAQIGTVSAGMHDASAWQGLRNVDMFNVEHKLHVS